jgi:hypothetical protein
VIIHSHVDEAVHDDATGLRLRPVSCVRTPLIPLCILLGVVVSGGAIGVAGIAIASVWS